MLISELNSIPDIMIRTYLKGLGLTFSGNVIELVGKHIDDKKLTTEKVSSFVSEMKNHGRKHIYLFTMPDKNWEQIENPKQLASKLKTYKENIGSKGILSDMVEQTTTTTDSTYLLQLQKTIQVPTVDKEKTITHEGREWAAIIYVDTSINIVFQVDLEQKEIQLRFDSISNIGNKREEILKMAHQFLNLALGMNNFDSVGLSDIASELEAKDYAEVFNLIAKVETENASGNTITGTVQIHADKKASDLPGGAEILSNDNRDVFVDTFDVLWIAEKSDGKLTRNIRTTIHSMTGDIHFRHHVFEGEFNYVLSCIREFAN